MEKKSFHDDLIQRIKTTNVNLKILRDKLEAKEEEIKNFINILVDLKDEKFKDDGNDFYSTKIGVPQLKADIVCQENLLKTLNEAFEYIENNVIRKGLNSNETLSLRLNNFVPFHEDEQEELIHNNGVDEEGDDDDEEDNDDDDDDDEKDGDNDDVESDAVTVPQTGKRFLFLFF